MSILKKIIFSGLFVTLMSLIPMGAGSSLSADQTQASFSLSYGNYGGYRNSYYGGYYPYSYSYYPYYSYSYYPYYNYYYPYSYYGYNRPYYGGYSGVYFGLGGSTW